MASTTQKNPPTPDAIIEHMRAVGEQYLAAARDFGTSYLDFYEKSCDRAIEFERSVAASTKQEWLSSIIDTQANMTQHLNATCTRPLRDLLK